MLWLTPQDRLKLSHKVLVVRLSQNLLAAPFQQWTCTSQTQFVARTPTPSCLTCSTPYQSSTNQSCLSVWSSTRLMFLTIALQWNGCKTLTSSTKTSQRLTPIWAHFQEVSHLCLKSFTSKLKHVEFHPIQGKALTRCFSRWRSASKSTMKYTMLRCRREWMPGKPVRRWTWRNLKKLSKVKMLPWKSDVN